MLVINANQEQKQVFNSLIEEMNAQVVWNGRFIIMGDRLVLEGIVRSLFFHFDIQKTEVQLIDLPTEDEEELEITEHPELEELITMAIYAFEKWGALKGVQIEQDVVQLDHIFAEILGAYEMEAFFSEEKLEFYQSGIRITYEDVVEAVLSFTGVKMLTSRLKLPVIGRQNPKDVQQPAAWQKNVSAILGTGAAGAGQASGDSEKEQRIGKYHARIGVLDRLSELQRKTLLRDIRNDKLLSEEEKEELYYPIEDYERQIKEQRAARDASAGALDEKAVAETIAKYHARIGVLDRLSELQRKTLLRDIRNDKMLSEEEKEKLYDPIEDYERQLEEQAAAKNEAASWRDPKAVSERIEKYHARISVLDRLSDLQRKALLRDIRNDKLLSEKEKEELYDPIEDYERQELRNAASNGSLEEKSVQGQQHAPAGDTYPPARDSKAVRERVEKYIARIGVLDRLSGLQKKTLVRDIQNDRLLNGQEKERLLYPIQDYEYQIKMQELEQTLSQRENRTYKNLIRLIGQAEQEEMFEKTRKAVLERLWDLRTQLGIQEVQAIMEQVPQHVERAEYQELLEKLAPYEDVDLAAYKEQLRKMRETLEIKEISNMLMKSRKKDRKDYMSLLRNIEEQGFAKENAAPYVERILDWVSDLDAARLKELTANAQTMDGDTAIQVYQTIRRESFLPALREQALVALTGRLEQISLGECAKLVQVLKNTVNGVIKENPRHHFYPAQKVLAKTATPEELRLIESAVSAYAQKRGRFEYPILMVDTSKECNGRDGMLLTPEHLFYSTRVNGYRIPLQGLKGIYISSGLLNHRSLIAEDAGGVRHKLPCAAEADEMKEWAKILDRFVRYLQEKAPQQTRFSDALKAEAETVCCSRCGCMYPDGGACPECGLWNVPV